MCKKPTFTHGPAIPYAKPRVLLTVLTKTVFPCVKTPCFTHDPGKNGVAIHSTSCEPFHRASPSATEVPLEPYSTLNRMTKSHFPHEIMKSAYVKWPVLHTASKSRMQNPVFYSRPSQIGVPVCKNPTFTHGPAIPYVKTPLLLTVLTKTVFPCVKTPLLLTANWLRV